MNAVTSVVRPGEGGCLQVQWLCVWVVHAVWVVCPMLMMCVCVALSER